MNGEVYFRTTVLLLYTTEQNMNGEVYFRTTVLQYYYSILLNCTQRQWCVTLVTMWRRIFHAEISTGSMPPSGLR